MGLLSDIANDILTIETDMDTPLFTWQGEDYVCIPSSLGNSQVLDIGGLGQENDLSLTVRINQFSNNLYPSENQTVIYKSVTYRINKVIKDGSGALIRVVLVNKSRGV